MTRNFNKHLRDLAPPALIRLYRKTIGRRYGFHGDFDSWQQARALTTGYDSRAIFAKSQAAVQKVKAGKAAYERDTVLFTEAEYDWPILCGLLRAAALHGNRLRVLDFGGGLGSLYFQHRPFLDGLAEVKWYVVEQPRFVEYGRSALEDQQLRFLADLETCLERHAVNVALLVSVLPYLEAPYEILDRILTADIPHLIIDRVPLLRAGDRDRLTIQKVPPRIYPASYPAWFFQRQNFLDRVRNGYRIHTQYPCAVESGIDATFEGFILEQNDRTA